MARILIIEDSTANLELMSFLLIAFGHTVQSATDGESGVSIAARDHPDAIVCDIQLPRLDGYEVVKRLKARADTRQTPVIAVTALAMVGDRDRGLSSGFDGYIDKPIDPERFVAQIEEFLDVGKRGKRPGIEAVVAPSLPEAAASRSRASVLVVDDSPVNRELLRQILSPNGYDVNCVSSIAEALGYLSHSVPDLVLTDIHMPDGNGFDLVSRVQADLKLANVKCFCISSSGWTGSGQATATRLGVPFVVRPIDPEELLKLVGQYLGLSETS
jgi:two-component system cell cycle response regulator